jgi:hypothetical protein
MLKILHFEIKTQKISPWGGGHPLPTPDPFRRLNPRAFGARPLLPFHRFGPPHFSDQSYASVVNLQAAFTRI